MESSAQSTKACRHAAFGQPMGCYEGGKGMRPLDFCLAIFRYKNEWIFGMDGEYTFQAFCSVNGFGYRIRIFPSGAFR